MAMESPTDYLRPISLSSLTAERQTAPGGGNYAYLGKPFHRVPGQRTQLEMGGEPFDVFLPEIPTDAAVSIAAGRRNAVWIRRTVA